jgi:hypothetical protein
LVGPQEAIGREAQVSGGLTFEGLVDRINNERAKSRRETGGDGVAETLTGFRSRRGGVTLPTDSAGRRCSKVGNERWQNDG